jgi:DcaP outer membrane protein
LRDRDDMRVFRQDSGRKSAMSNPRSSLRCTVSTLALFCCVLAPLAFVSPALAEDATPNSFEVYGFGQVDVIQDFNRVDPDWEDAFRPSKIPIEDGAFGPDGQNSISVKQSRLGAVMRGEAASNPYEVKVEFDVFGVGDDAGQTTIRFRHVYGRWGPILGGQTNTLFMDGDLFPNVIDYWGPNGMVFVRNPQIRYYIADRPDFLAAIALERPSNDIDPGQIRTFDPEVASGLTNTEELPDLTGQVRWMGEGWHVQVSGIARQVSFATAGNPDGPSGDEFGWGIDLGTAFRTGPATFRLGVVYGEGIATYMNDGGMDLAPDVTLTGTPPVITEADAEAVPLLGVTAYVDFAWTDQLSSALGYSFVEVDNTDFQEPTAFHRADYASVNLLWTPASNVMTGLELMWGRREDNDGDSGDDVRLQYSFKVSFSSGDLLAGR